MAEGTTSESSPKGSAFGSRWTVMGAVLGLLAATAGIVWSQRGGVDDLPRQRPEFTFNVGSHPVGQTEFQVGEMFIKEKGADIEILEVKALTSSNVEQLGAIAAWPRDLGATEPNLGSAAEFPDSEIKRHHPAFGLVIPAAEVDYIAPGDDASRPISVAAGFRLTSGDVGAFNGLLLRYRVGGKIKQHRYPYAGFMCSEPNRCGFDEESTQDFEQRTLIRFGLVPQNAYS